MRSALSRTVFVILFGVLVVGLFLVDWSGAEPAEPVVFAGETMGTTYSVQMDADLTSLDSVEVVAAAEAVLSRIEGLMSTYDPDSEVSQLNRSDGWVPVPASRELVEVLGIARRVSERSGGAFDVSIGPLVDAWGFGPVGDLMGPPIEIELSELLDRVGQEKVVVDSLGHTIAKLHPDLHIDLSGVAKGFGVDRVSEALVGLGYRRFVVEIGGDLRAVGERRDGRPWRVGLERPDVSGFGLFGSIEVRDEAVATSGDYRNFYVQDGVRYSHLVDPRSGRPVPFRGLAVSVLAPSTALADAWATALAVLGPEAGLQVAESNGVQAVFLSMTDGEVLVKSTASMQGRLEVIDP